MCCRSLAKCFRLRARIEMGLSAPARSAPGVRRLQVLRAPDKGGMIRCREGQFGPAEAHGDPIRVVASVVEAEATEALGLRDEVRPPIAVEGRRFHGVTIAVLCRSMLQREQGVALRLDALRCEWPPAGGAMVQLARVTTCRALPRRLADRRRRRHRCRTSARRCRPFLRERRSGRDRTLQGH